MASILVLLLADTTAFIPAASAREAIYRIDIVAGPLSAGLARFSEITGHSVGLPGDMPRTMTRPVRGTLSADAALDRLLTGSGLRAVRVSGSAFRLVRILPPPPAPKPAAPHPTAPAMALPAPMDIIVTAQKRPQLLASVPMSLSVVSPDSLGGDVGAPGSRDVSFSTEGLAMTNLGPGRNRQFIRGVADSPFTGQSQSTVAVQLDDARITFDAPDPDLRLIDVDRIEILKGPQGPLYGSGALGGIYHIVTRRPDPAIWSGSLRTSVEGVTDGSVGTGIEGIANIPVVTGRLTLRAVGYRYINAGWIDNVGVRTDSNSTETVGLRLALQWRPADDWTVDAGVVSQDINARDSQYVLAGRDTLSRPSRFAEPTDNDFKLVHATVEGDIGALHFLSATNYVDHGFDYTLDATDAADRFGIVGTARFSDSRAYSIFNQELRLSSTGRNHWVAGLSYLRATTRSEATVAGDDGAIQTVEALDRRTSEYAVFGEAHLGLASWLDATLGLRLFRSIAEDGAIERSGRDTQRLTKTILSPSMALSVPLDDRGLIYLRYARAMRPGGLAAAGETETGRFDADELDTVDLGFRRASRDGHIALSASSYVTRWKDIQSDYLLPDGLIATRNAGSGLIVGIEGAIDWQFGGGFSLSAGGSVQKARLTHAVDGVRLDDQRLPITPELSGRLSLAKAFRLSDWHGRAGIQANYVGSTRLSFDSGLDRAMGEYAQLAVHSDIERAAWTIGTRIDNLLDVKGDSFAFGNPFSIRKGQQFTPVRPRTFTVSLTRKW